MLKKVFVSHSTQFDYKKELYMPLKESRLSRTLEFFFPHETDVTLNTKEAIQNVYDVVLAEVSYPSTGQGIELGWANDANKKIICIYKKEAKISSSLHELTNYIYPYITITDLVDKIETVIKEL